MMEMDATVCHDLYPSRLSFTGPSETAVIYENHVGSNGFVKMVELVDLLW